MNRLCFMGGTLLAATALGSLLTMVQPAAAGCNSGNVANTDLLSSANCQANASGGGATAVGEGAIATSTSSTAVGRGANSAGTPGIFSTAVGVAASALGDNSVAVGSSDVVATQAKGAYSTAIGGGAQAGGTGATAFANGGNTAIGGNARAGNTASGQTNSTAVGFQALANAQNATALGQGATANFAGSAAFGQGAIAGRDNQQIFGTASNSYTMAGLTTTSTAAQVGALQIVTSDSTGTLGTNTAAGLGLATTAQIGGINSQLGLINTQIGGINSQLTTINSRLNSIDSHLGLLDQQVNELRTETRRGIASALAANSFTTPIRRGGTTVGVTGGFFQGESAVGVSVAHRVYAVPNLVIYGAYGTGGGGNTNSGKVGASMEF